MGNEERLVYTAAPRLTFTFVRRALMFTFRRALRMCVFAPASDPSPRYLMLLSRERICLYCLYVCMEDCEMIKLGEIIVRGIRRGVYVGTVLIGGNRSEIDGRRSNWRAVLR